MYSTRTIAQGKFNSRKKIDVLRVCRFLQRTELFPIEFVVIGHNTNANALPLQLGNILARKFGVRSGESLELCIRLRMQMKIRPEPTRPIVKEFLFSHLIVLYLS